MFEEHHYQGAILRVYRNEGESDFNFFVRVREATKDFTSAVDADPPSWTGTHYHIDELSDKFARITSE